MSKVTFTLEDTTDGFIAVAVDHFGAFNKASHAHNTAGIMMGLMDELQREEHAATEEARTVARVRAGKSVAHRIMGGSGLKA